MTYPSPNAPRASRRAGTHPVVVAPHITVFAFAATFTRRAADSRCRQPRSWNCSWARPVMSRGSNSSRGKRRTLVCPRAQSAYCSRVASQGLIRVGQSQRSRVHPARNTGKVDEHDNGACGRGPLLSSDRSGMFEAEKIRRTVHRRGYTARLATVAFTRYHGKGAQRRKK